MKKAFKMFLAVASWISVGSISVQGVLLTNPVFAWQTLLVLGLIVVFCATSVVAIQMGPKLKGPSDPGT